jgi:hypothetical protein
MSSAEHFVRLHKLRTDDAIGWAYARLAASTAVRTVFVCTVDIDCALRRWLPSRFRKDSSIHRQISPV